MTQAYRDKLLEDVCRDVSYLARVVSLDRESHPGRVLPTLDKYTLWRVLPRLLRRAAAAGSGLTPARKAHLAALADTIELGLPAPSVEF